MVNNIHMISNNGTATPHSLKIDGSRTALVIVDVQPEYWSECPPVRQDFPNFPSNISKLINQCRRVQHDNDAKSLVWIRAAYNYEQSPWLNQFHRLHQGAIPPVVKASCRWEDFAQPLPDEDIILKSSWSATSNTRLLNILKEDDIDTVLVCGLITSVCVQHSAFGLFEAGYRTIVVPHACADRGMARHEAALSLYGNYMYETMSVDSVCQELARCGAGKSIKNTDQRSNHRSSTSSTLVKDNHDDDVVAVPPVLPTKNDSDKHRHSWYDSARSKKIVSSLPVSFPSSMSLRTTSTTSLSTLCDDQSEGDDEDFIDQ